MHNETILLNSVASLLMIRPSVILSRCRIQSVADARAVYAYLLRTTMRYTYQRIGDILKRRPASVMHMVNNVDSWLQVPTINPDCAAVVRELTDKTGTDD